MTTPFEGLHLPGNRRVAPLRQATMRIAAVVVILATSGCDFFTPPPTKTAQAPGKTPTAKTIPKPTPKPSEPAKKPQRPPLTEPLKSTSSPNRKPEPHADWTAQVAAWDVTEAHAVARVCGEIHASLQVGPTLVVWLIDGSASANRFRGAVVQGVETYYPHLLELAAALPTEGEDASPRLLTAVHAFGQKHHAQTTQPTADRDELLRAFATVPVDSSGQERPFTALQAALTQYLSQRTQQRRELLFVLVTDEAGDDDDQVEATIAQCAKYRIPVLVIGSPAPLGEVAARSTWCEAEPGQAQPGDRVVVRQGPESRQAEHVPLPSVELGNEVKLVDSGFGPFALEWLARKTGGRFLAVRAGAAPEMAPGELTGGWPAGTTLRFNPAVMSKYAPDYVSAAAYQALLAENQARAALVAAAQVPLPTLLDFPDRKFMAKDAAALKRDVDKAQQGVAKYEPEIQRFYDALSPGESDRTRLTGPRWQASYDLALGRVQLAKARIEGYNAMLALLKQGKKFAKETSKRWVLKPSKSTEAGSAIQKLADRGRESLERVVKDHPGTPWALIAAREVHTPAGWTWVEE